MKQHEQLSGNCHCYQVNKYYFSVIINVVHCQDGDDNKSQGNNESHHDNNGLTANERVITSLVAGAIAGAIAKTTIAPLDRTKIFFQTSPNTKFNTGELLKYIGNTCKSTGFLSLWRGNSATMARIVPYAGIQFTAHEHWKRVLRVEQTQNSEILRFVAGSLAGVTAQSLTYPLDLTRARLAISPKSKYSSLLDVFIKTIRNEGLKGLFKGYVPSLLGVIPYAGCSFYCYERLKRVWTSKFGEDSIGAIERLWFGAAAGSVGMSVSYPFDVVRRRLQTSDGDHGVQGRFKVFKLIANVIKNEGVIRGLYKGVSLNWIQGPIQAGISFTVYDWIQEFFKHSLHPHDT